MSLSVVARSCLLSPFYASRAELASLARALRLRPHDKALAGLCTYLRQIQPDMARYGQIWPNTPDTSKYGQRRPDTTRYGEIRPDTACYDQILLDVPSHGQVSPDTLRWQQMMTMYQNCASNVQPNLRTFRSFSVQV